MRRWYELDGFLMKNRERQRHVKKVCTVGEMALLDHKPKKMTLMLKKKKWRKAYQGRKVPLIKWEELRDEQVANDYRRKMGEALSVEQPEAGEVTSGWAGLTEKVVEVAKEVCGVRSKRVENPWMVGKDEEIVAMRRRVSGAVTRRNEMAVEVRQGRETEQRLEERREEVRRERGEWRRTVRRWEREYWDRVVRECQEAEEVGNTGLLYKTLR